MTTWGWILLAILIVILIIFIIIWWIFYNRKQEMIFNIFKRLEVENQEYLNNKYLKNTLQEIDVKLKLNPNEHAYSDEIINVYLTKKQKQSKLSSKFFIPFEKGINVGYDNGKKNIENNLIPFQLGHLVVTNHRLLIINEDITTTWDLNLIKNIELSIFQIKNEIKQGIYLFMEDKCYIMIINNLDLAYLIYRMWKK
ncbi:hypothetical protein [Spiroplasma chrysopicola]|uniref:Transmembrane protein n=1 Tax=Spiroplasma chrysopicola DF-1 TaxID=1276227 RepID=R4UAV7_9MOLU|nr:hypothetical protein [Spiroplasma chrysopicola]AGM25039.1 hypothetical protein SCHRY_v1c04580 [Spiroplasma chrysopicola DF-1]